MQRAHARGPVIQGAASGSGKAGKVLAAIALSVVLPVGIVGVGIELFSNAEMNKDREKVRFCHAHCRQLKEDPHVTRDARGIAYGACQKFEQDFKMEWGVSPGTTL